MDLSKPLEDCQLAFVDLETTGLDAVMGDSICEIGALKVKNRKVIDKFHSLINPEKPMPPEAYRVHKISDQDLKSAPLFYQVADKLLDFLSNSALCAYNVEFDTKFINQSLKRISRPGLDLPTIDVLAMARDALDLPRYNLESVAKSLAIDCPSLHRAMDDALVTYQTFFKLIGRFQEKRVVNLEDYISLYSCENAIFRVKENKKIVLLKEAAARSIKLNIKYFSSQCSLEQEQALPLRIFREGRSFYLLYQGRYPEAQRIALSRILDIQPATQRA